VGGVWGGVVGWVEGGVVVASPLPKDSG